MNFLKNVLKSTLIGIGSIAPGFSGGALAIVLGLYEKILNAINNLFKDFKKHGVFLISIGLGAGIGIIIFSSIQLTLIKRFEMPTMFTFAGLVVGTIPTLFIKANKKGYSKKYIIPFIITLAIGLLFTYINNTTISDNIEKTEVILNFPNIIYLIIIGFIMAGSLVIPGISGTVLLFLLGAYGLVLNSIAGFLDILKLSSISEMFYAFLDKVIIIIPLLVGLLIGVLFFSKLMEYLLNRYYGLTYYAIIGFVIGSIPELIPNITFNKTFIISLVCFLIASIISLQINKLVKD
ncbi:MAG TPA: DUF368 domain-containing protein [Haloplasmataceae bacterium]